MTWARAFNVMHHMMKKAATTANNVLYLAGNNHERIFPPKKDAKGERQ
jgi:hypothetical protein